MNRWLYGILSLAFLVLLVGTFIVTPKSKALPDGGGIGQLQGIPGTNLQSVEERFQSTKPEDIIARVRLSDSNIKDVKFRDIRVSKDGTVWIDATWSGDESDRPSTAPAWNQLAMKIGNEIAGDDTPNHTVVIQLHDEDKLMSEWTARSMGG